MTFAVFNREGNSPLTKQILTSVESQYEKKSLNVLSKNTGIPFGPLDFEISTASIIFAISSGIVGDRKKEEPSGVAGVAKLLGVDLVIHSK